jgi:hypothetical protein
LLASSGVTVFKSNQSEKSAKRLIEEQIYAQVADELSRGQKRDGLWAKALADNDAEETKAKACYIRYRVQSIIDERVILKEVQRKEGETAKLRAAERERQNRTTERERQNRTAERDRQNRAAEWDRQNQAAERDRQNRAARWDRQNRTAERERQTERERQNRTAERELHNWANTQQRQEPSSQFKNFFLLLGVCFIPIIFAWFTLQSGYKTSTRVLSFSWLAVIVLAILGND